MPPGFLSFGTLQQPNSFRENLLADQGSLGFEQPPEGIGRQAPTGPNTIAQGNALGSLINNKKP